MFDWLEPITWEKDCFSSVLMRLKFWVSDFKSQKLQNQSWNTLMSRFSHYWRSSSGFFLFNERKKQVPGFFWQFKWNHETQLLGCSHFLSSISKAAFLSMTSCRNPSFAVAPPSCRSVRKYFLEKLLQILVLYSTPTWNWIYFIKMYLIKKPKPKKTQKKTPKLIHWQEPSWLSLDSWSTTAHTTPQLLQWPSN